MTDMQSKAAMLALDWFIAGPYNVTPEQVREHATVWKDAINKLNDAELESRVTDSRSMLNMYISR